MPLPLRLAHLAAAEQLVEDALDRVLANIDDPNTDPTAPRAIVLTLLFRPDEDRRSVSLAPACATKLAPIRAARVPILLGRHHGLLTAILAPTQEDLFPTPAAAPRLVRDETESA